MLITFSLELMRTLYSQSTGRREGFPHVEIGLCQAFDKWLCVKKMGA